MKLDDLKDFKDLETDFDDPLEILFDDSEIDKDKKKKKKKKDGSKKKDKESQSREDYKDSLKDLSKKELRKKAESMGIDLDYVDQDSKKALRKAIMETRDGVARSEKSKASSVPALKENEHTKSKPATKRPPYFYDEDSRDFVIGNALDTEDVTVFQAMQSLGKLRTEKRPDDGFGELMDKITRKLLSDDEPKKPALPDGDIIDVEYTVIDEPKPAKKKDASHHDRDGAPTKEEMAKTDAMVNKAIADLQATVASGKKNGGKKRDHESKK